MKKTKLIMLGAVLAAFAASSCKKEARKTQNDVTDRNKTINTATSDGLWDLFFMRSGATEWTAGDATISIAVTSGSSTSITHNVFLQGDSYIGGITTSGGVQYRPCPYFDVYNIIQTRSISGGTMTTAFDNSKTLVERTSVKFPAGTAKVGNKRLWPHHGFEKTDKVYAYYGAYDDAMEFSNELYLAKFNYNVTNATTANVVVTALNATTVCGVTWGSWVIVDGSNMYIYGSRKESGIFYMYLAKGTTSDPSGNSWTYYKGKNGAGVEQWESSPTTGLPLYKVCSPGPGRLLSNHLSVVKFTTSGGTKYGLINQEAGWTCSNGTEICLYGLASSPVGPFTFNKVIATVDNKYPGSTTTIKTYDAQAHPEEVNANGLLVSYNVNDVGCVTCPASPNNKVKASGYRPRFLRIPLADFGATAVQKTW